MEFNRRDFFTIVLGVSIGLNIILSFFIFQDKLWFKSTSMPKLTGSRQEEKTPPVPVQESKPKPEVKIEKEYEVLIPEVRQNDPSNDGWMTRKWNGVYSNPERLLYSDKYDELNLNEPVYEEVNTSTPNSFVVFENEELSLRLPFNEKWGDPLYKFEPYIVDDQVSWDKGAVYVSFGKIAYPLPEGGFSYHLSPPFSLVIRDRNVDNDMGRYVSKLRDASYFKLKNLTSSRDSQKVFHVLEYIQGGLGDRLAIDFFGDKHVYTFSIHEYYNYSYDDLEDIVSTIELK